MKFGLFFVAGLLSLGAAACSDSGPALDIGSRSRSSAALQSFGTCDELTDALRGHVKEEMRVQLLQYLDESMAYRKGVLADAENAPAADSTGSGRQEGVDFSGTNNQEAGVDESDFVKTDGYNIYVLSGSKLEIMGVPQFGELTQVGEADIEGYPISMLLAGDRAVVFSMVYTYNLAAEDPIRPWVEVECAAAYGRTPDGQGGGCFRTWALTKVTVLDLTNRAAPIALRQLYLEGSLMTGRKIDTAVRMISYAWIDIPGLVTYPELPADYYDGNPFSSADRNVLRHAVKDAIDHNNAVIAATPLTGFVPLMLEKLSDGSVKSFPFTAGACSRFVMARDATARGFTSILGLDLSASELALDATHILSNWSQIYASLDTLVVVEPANDWWWYWHNDGFEEATNVHRFDTRVAGVTTYTGSGRIDGTVLNQFSISELDGNIRIASTTGQWNRFWENDPAPPDNHIFVLAGEDELAIVGQLDGIATGERIWSARFVGAQAFLVTFNYIDPLWTIDLANPVSPVIMGELQVPGVSTYIHPLDNGHLLNIGFGGSDAGLNWATAVSLFDVTDFANPALDSSLSLAPPAGNGWSWAWSEATYEHKAFTYWPALSMLAVPVSTYRSTYGSYEYFSKLTLIDVSLTGGLSIHGSVDHSSFYNDQANTWWYYQDIRRSIFMGDFIYAVSDRGVTATRIADMVETARLPLPGSQLPYYWY
jgi:hypothetical protein